MIKCACGYTSERIIKFCPECGNRLSDGAAKWKFFTINSTGMAMSSCYHFDVKRDGSGIYVKGAFFINGSRVEIGDWRMLTNESAKKVMAIPFGMQDTVKTGSMASQENTGVQTGGTMAPMNGMQIGAAPMAMMGVMPMTMMGAQSGAMAMDMMGAQSGGMMGAQSGGMIGAQNGGMMGPQNGGMTVTMPGGMMSDRMEMRDGVSSEFMIIYESGRRDLKVMDYEMINAFLDIMRAEFD